MNEIPNLATIEGVSEEDSIAKSAPAWVVCGELVPANDKDVEFCVIEMLVGAEELADWYVPYWERAWLLLPLPVAGGVKS